MLGEATWSLSDNLNLILGARAPIGPARTEFGGLALFGPTAPYTAPPSEIYVQLRWYR